MTETFGQQMMKLAEKSRKTITEELIKRFKIELIKFAKAGQNSANVRMAISPTECMHLAGKNSWILFVDEFRKENVIVLEVINSPSCSCELNFLYGAVPCDIEISFKWEKM